MTSLNGVLDIELETFITCEATCLFIDRQSAKPFVACLRLEGFWFILVVKKAEPIVCPCTQGSMSFGLRLLATWTSSLSNWITTYNSHINNY